MYTLWDSTVIINDMSCTVIVKVYNILGAQNRELINKLFALWFVYLYVNNSISRFINIILPGDR